MDRRNFLLGSAVAAQAGFGQSADAVPTAIIGTGNRGSYLLRSVLDQPNAKVMMVCDKKPERLDKAARTVTTTRRCRKIDTAPGHWTCAHLLDRQQFILI